MDDVRKKTTNVGKALQRAMREIETANPSTLYSIFGDAQWTNKDRLSDSLLCDLVEHFSKLPLGNQTAQADVLGRAYEYLIKKFADATNKNAGEFSAIALVTIEDTSAWPTSTTRILSPCTNCWRKPARQTVPRS